MMLKKILSHKEISVIFLLSTLFVIGGSFWGYFSLRNSSQPLVIHFNDLAGITQIGNPIGFLAVGFIAILFLFLNFVLAIELEARDRFLGKLLTAGALFLSILLFIGYVAIISSN